MIAERGLTLIGITSLNLENADAIQLELPFARRDSRSLDGVLDQVRDRYGSSALVRGVLLGRRSEISVPLLPD